MRRNQTIILKVSKEEKDKMLKNVEEINKLFPYTLSQYIRDLHRHFGNKLVEMLTGKSGLLDKEAIEHLKKLLLGEE